MAVWRFLRIVTMILAVGVGVGAELLMHRVARTGDVRVIRSVFGLARPIQRAVPLLFLIGLGFGLVAVAAGSFDFLARWLIIS